MALDVGLRRQLVAARKNITTQLMQLEGASLDPYSLGGSPDSRTVYAELQRELHEIDDLLGREGSQDGEAETAYQPMATLVTTQGQWMWRFRGVAAGDLALSVIGWVALYVPMTGRANSPVAAASLATICLALIWMAARSRGREFRLFLFTIAIGAALVGAAVLVATLST